MSNSEYLIELENITTSYALAGRERLEILHNVSGSFPRNAWSILLGASGSGKTTMLNLIGALEKPDSGTIRFDGVDYNELMKDAGDLLSTSSQYFLNSFYISEILWT